MNLLKIIYRFSPLFIKKYLKLFHSKMRSRNSKIMELISPNITRKVMMETKKIKNIDDAIEFAFTFKYFTFSIKPSQVKSEITKLLKMIQTYNPKLILEIGTSLGGTLFLFSKVADTEATITSIDLPGGPFGGGYPEWKKPIYQSFAKKGSNIKLIRANSHDLTTYELVKTIYNNRLIDFLFIDGDHTYEGVKDDFGMYSNLVKKGGIIAIHDIVVHPAESGCNVEKFWKEIKTNYNHLEIIEDIKQGWAGIGVIYV
jgi:predicted O-methyltransferase YrrM